MRKPLFVLITGMVVLATANQGWALAKTFTSAATINPLEGSSTLQATATFATSGTDLLVTLSNIGGDVARPSDVLTGIFFSLLDTNGNDISLSPASALLSTGSTVLFDSPPAGGNVGGEWAYASGLTAPGNATAGISSTGLNLFGQANFGGANLAGPTGVDGLQYGITAAADILSTGNPKVTGGTPLIQNSVSFTLGLPTGFDSSAVGAVTNVSFQYGTSLSEPNLPGDGGIPPDAVVPEPGTMLLLGTGLLGLGGIARRRRKAS